MLAAYVWSLSQQAAAAAQPPVRTIASQPVRPVASVIPIAAGRGRRGACRCTQPQQKIYPRAVQRLVRRWRWALVWADAARLLRPAVAEVERPPGGAVRPRRAALLHLRPGAVPAGLHLPDRAADHQRLVAVPVHRGRRPAVVRLRLPADGLHRDLHVGRAPAGRRPQRAHAARQRRRGSPRSCCASGSSTCVWIAHRPVDRLHLRRLLHADPRAGRCECLQTSASGRGKSFWVLFYGFATYGNAGFMREQVCKYMCPYARFQSAMFDHDTLIISYDAAARRAARRPRRASADKPALGLGDCIDCTLCVQVCPTGIDIRKGLQYECIGCAACIDVCNGVMDKMDYPRGLIRYATQNGMARRWTPRADAAPRAAAARAGLQRGAAGAVASAFVASLVLRTPLQGRRGARPRRAGAPGRRRPDRERLPPAGHERHRAAAALPHRGQRHRRAARGRRARRGRGRRRPSRAGCRCAVQVRPTGAALGRRAPDRTSRSRARPTASASVTVDEKSTFVVPR